MVSCQKNQPADSTLKVFESTDQLVEDAKEIITEISVEDFKKLYDGEEYFVMIDVRTVAEYNNGYIPGAASIPRGVLEFRIASEPVWDGFGLYIPEKADLIILNCKSGNRSALATKALTELGYENVKSLQGGWVAFHEAFPDLNEKITVEHSGSQQMSSEADSAGGC